MTAAWLLAAAGAALVLYGMARGRSALGLLGCALSALALLAAPH